jgi:hypothetical protein
LIGEIKTGWRYKMKRVVFILVVSIFCVNIMPLENDNLKYDSIPENCFGWYISKTYFNELLKNRSHILAMNKLEEKEVAVSVYKEVFYGITFHEGYTIAKESEEYNFSNISKGIIYKDTEEYFNINKISNEPNLELVILKILFPKEYINAKNEKLYILDENHIMIGKVKYEFRFDFFLNETNADILENTKTKTYKAIRIIKNKIFIYNINLNRYGDGFDTIGKLVDIFE